MFSLLFGIPSFRNRSEGLCAQINRQNLILFSEVFGLDPKGNQFVHTNLPEIVAFRDKMFLMTPLKAKITGPVGTSRPDSDTVILFCDRSFRWPVVFGLSGAVELWVGFWLPEPTSLFFGVFSIIACSCFLFCRPQIILSAKTASLERRPLISFFRTGRDALRLDFSEIHEFLLEAEFEAAPDKPFVWHLIAVRNDGKRVPLTWHFVREPILRAAQQAARVTGKGFREESNPWNSSRWERWGYNLLG
jgi:hypothetical protein